MKFLAIILSLFTLTFFMNCGETASFGTDEARFRSLADGETIEVVSNEELNDATGGDGTTGDGGDDGDCTDCGDGGDGGDDGGRDGDDSDDDGNDDDGDDHNDDGNDDDNNCRGNNCGDNGNNGGRDKEKTCKRRILDQDDKGDHDDMMTSPEEMDEDEDMNRVTRCGSKGHKVLVCHHSNGGAPKTLCIGRPALEAHVRSRGAFSKAGGNHFHKDYAGACETDNDEEEGED